MTFVGHEVHFTHYLRWVVRDAKCEYYAILLLELDSHEYTTFITTYIYVVYL